MQFLVNPISPHLQVYSLLRLQGYTLPQKSFLHPNKKEAHFDEKWVKKGKCSNLGSNLGHNYHLMIYTLPCVQGYTLILSRLQEYTLANGVGYPFKFPKTD